MTTPSKGGAAFLVFFGLMFFVPGLIAFYVFVIGSPQLPLSGKLFGGGIALFFAVIGGGLVYGAFAGYRRMQQQAAIEEANPLSPWLWKRDWAERRARSRNKGKEIALWVACIFVSMILLPGMISLPRLINQLDPRSIILLGFSAIGVILFIYALRATLRRRRFGETYFEFYSLPFSPGGRLTGRIHLQLNADAQHGIALQLSCLRKATTGSGDSRSTTQTVLWQADQSVASGALGLDSSGRTIPVDFAIPSDAYVTDQDNPSDEVVWVLHAEADVPGVNYRDDFEVPVFKTSQSSAAGDSFAREDGAAAASSGDADSAAVSAPANPKVVVSSQAGGTEFYFPAFRNPGRVWLLLLFTAIWTGAVYLLLHFKAPWLFALVFGGSDIFLVFGLMHFTFATARIRVGNGEIISTKRTLGVGSTKRFAISEIEGVVAVTGGQQNGTHGEPIYSIRLRTKSGKRFTLADEISTRQEARWIVSQIESLAGLKIDTHVEADAPFGMPAQPPQPGQLSSVYSRRKASRFAAVPVAFFVLCVAGMFAWQGWRFSTFKSRANSSRSSRANQNTYRAATASVPSSSAKRSAPLAMLTDADVARILALPVQDQAEELLERAIGHDPKALEVFDQNVESWVGHIRLTDNMKQLERRSEYSTDLRVRYANADINLTLDGWQKNEQAAAMLIERAKTDLQYRAAAVYFLGMLAGRGVAYDRIHPVLLDYAKHDPDATVRQWAVEGMRYLGKDEALEELWESFTQDPSMAVRDRAGCNISDCGNFTRLQRMRMVPKFLALLQDSKTSSQMRSWCFMALHEITDENLPGNPQAWQTWYGQHGAAKLAEFERLDWWRVRGDE